MMLNRYFNPFYDSHFLISYDDNEDLGGRLIVELWPEELVRLRDEINYVLKEIGHEVYIEAMGDECVGQSRGLIMVDVSILLRGCDAETLFVMKCTEEQYKFLQMVAEKSQEESTYSCMSDIHIDKAKPCKYTESGWCDKVPAGICSVCYYALNREECAI